MNGSSELLAPLLPLLVGAPLLLGALCAALRTRRMVRHGISFATLLGILVFGVLLVMETSDGSILAHQVGLWDHGVAIPFVVDAFSALMLTFVAVLGLTSVLFAAATHEARARFYHPFVLFLFGGVSGALMTGDIFNLFVFIEVMLLPSYGLMSMMGAKLGANGARIFVTVNL